MGLRDMLDMVGLELRDYESERGTKHSFSYDVRHFYKKLYFNPGFVAEQREQWRNSPATVEGLRTRSVSTTKPPSLEAWRTLSLPEGKGEREEGGEREEEEKEEAENTEKTKGKESEA